MKIKKVIKTDKGEFNFDGNLSEEEHAFLVEVGLATLLSQGALPFLDQDKVDTGEVALVPGHG